MSALYDYSDNPVLSELDRLQASINRLRELVIRQEAEPATGGEDVTLKKAAEILEQNYVTVAHGSGDTECLFSMRITKGRRIYLPKKAVLRHRQIVLTNGFCGGLCKQENVVTIKR